MGLDMFAYRTSVEPASSTDFEVSDENISQIHYWRKHPNLHGWMESLYYEKGGKSDCFNCVNVQLTQEDLQRLEEDIKNGELPQTQGFFFGQSQQDVEEVNEDLQFVEDARQAIKNGDHVFYSSWW